MCKAIRIFIVIGMILCTTVPASANQIIKYESLYIANYSDLSFQLFGYFNDPEQVIQAQFPQRVDAYVFAETLVPKVIFFGSNGTGSLLRITQMILQLSSIEKNIFCTIALLPHTVDVDLQERYDYMQHNLIFRVLDPMMREKVGVCNKGYRISAKTYSFSDKSWVVIKKR